MKISVGAVLVLAALLLAVVVASCGSDTADPSVAAPASRDAHVRRSAHADANHR